MSEPKPKVVWEGAASLKRYLVPVDSLEDFPGNPRVGDVPAIAASLRRFGQVQAVTVDGSRIVAGHHVVRAARELGFTHVAVVSHDFGNEDEQRAFLLASNRTADLGGYDSALLVEHLKYLAELDALEGTGFSTDDLDDELARLRSQLDAEPLVPVSFLAKPPSELVEMVLLFTPEQRQKVEVWVQIIAKECGTDEVSETVYRGMEIAAKELNQAIRNNRIDNAEG